MSELKLGSSSAIARSASVRTPALDGDPQLVDSDRVRAIRSALTDGRYPLVPERIGDAMIAAGILWRVTNP